MRRAYNLSGALSCLKYREILNSFNMSEVQSFFESNACLNLIEVKQIFFLINYYLKLLNSRRKLYVAVAVVVM